MALLEEALDALPEDDSVLRVELLASLSQQLYLLPYDERRARACRRLARDGPPPQRTGHAGACALLLEAHPLAVRQRAERLTVSNEALSLAREVRRA